MAVPDYREKLASISPWKAGFGPEGGKATLPVFCSDANLDETIADAIGSVSMGTDGRLVRKLPRAHPRWPSLVVSRIENIIGVGPSAYAVANPGFGPSPLEMYGSFEEYQLDLVFEQRPYFMLPDAQIATEEITWYSDAGVDLRSKIAHEWERFVLKRKPGAQPDYITAQQGQYVFRVNGGGAPDGTAFIGMPKVLYPQVAVQLVWHFVPIQVIQRADNNIDPGLGRINQTGFMDWAPGSLLFTSYKIVKDDTPPFPETLPNGDIARTCHIEFNFVHLDPALAGEPPSITNQSIVQSGHNLRFHFAQGGWYFVQTKGTGGTFGPSVYPSYPFQLLFTAPGAI